MEVRPFCIVTNERIGTFDGSVGHLGGQHLHEHACLTEIVWVRKQASSHKLLNMSFISHVINLRSRSNGRVEGGVSNFSFRVRRAMLAASNVAAEVPMTQKLKQHGH